MHKSFRAQYDKNTNWMEFYSKLTLFFFLLQIKEIEKKNDYW